MKRRNKLICFFVFMGIVLSPVLYNVIVIRSRIYYIIEYNINLSNREEIIDKVENLDYTAYLNKINPDIYAEIQTYVDRDLIDFLKSQIENDIGFKWWPFYHHYFLYSFLGENHSKLYLTYNNNTIFSLKDQNNQSLLLREDKYWEYRPNWYLNFTQIPYVYSHSSTLLLNDSIFVEINVEYEWNSCFVCLHQYSFEQYLVLTKNLDFILIFNYYDIFID